MNQFLRGVARALVESVVLPDPILEIGSYQVEGQDELIDLRGLFQGRPYIGVDFRPGPGVDCVANVESLPQSDASIGTVIAFSAFEHVEHFWIGFEEVYRVLRPDGVFVLSCPFYFHQHDFPGDYWRFTPQAFELLLAKYPTRMLGWNGPPRRPLHVWAAAFRESARQPTAEQFALSGAARSIRLRAVGIGSAAAVPVGRVLCGRRPFAPYLDRNRWETVFQQSSG